MSSVRPWEDLGRWTGTAGDMAALFISSCDDERAGDRKTQLLKAGSVGNSWLGLGYLQIAMVQVGRDVFGYW